MSPATTPKNIDELVDQWRAQPDRLVLLIDETRDHLEGEHREFIVFTAVVVTAQQLLGHLSALASRREKLPELSRDTSFKGRNLLRLLEDPAFQPFVVALGMTLTPPTRIYITATTIQNVEQAPAKVLLTAANDVGRPREVRGPELKVVVNFVRRLCDELVGPKGRVDVIVDRSKAMGLDERTRHLDDKFEGFFGSLIEGGADLGIISDSDQGLFRDALLLPDLAGYLLVHKTPQGLNAERAAVQAGSPPFFIREVASAELAPAIATVLPGPSRA